jgi:soluble lytic murein transglycosylase
MARRIIVILGTFAVLLAAAAAVFLLTEKDPVYRLSEWAGLGRFEAYDDAIASAARRHGVDPLLVKAVIWQESRFHPEKVGGHGERGLMQVTEPAAQDWVNAEGIETFVPEDLFDPKTNIEVGTWYLGRALRHWSSQADPLPFAWANTMQGVAACSVGRAGRRFPPRNSSAPWISPARALMSRRCATGRNIMASAGTRLAVGSKRGAGFGRITIL